MGYFFNFFLDPVVERNERKQLILEKEKKDGCFQIILLELCKRLGP